ncbi:MAG: S41 family peptidase, partial [Gemmatimonadales bacterium]|nr:S41 family peptidase [Gemmatimonadales bacterium]
RPLQSTTDWQRCEIILDVPPTATRIVFGAILAGSGSLWMDDLALTAADSAATPTGQVLGARPETASGADLPAEPHNLDFESAGVPIPPAAPPRMWESRQLTTRGLANLTAFARLLGYVRFFHPSEAGRVTNWDQFAVRGISAVEGSPTPDSLAVALRAVFHDVAATVVVAPSNRIAAARRTAPLAKPADASDAGVAYWLHYGIQLGPNAPGPYRSRLRIVPAGAPDSLAPSPDAAIEATLGGGVSARIPLALRVAVPSGGADDRERSPGPDPASARYWAEDRAARLADVVLLWAVMQHFYPYFDVVRTDWTATLEPSLLAAAADPTAAAFERTLRLMLVALHDGHGGVRPAARSPLGAAPVALDWVEDQLVVSAVADSTQDTVRRGDVVVTVEGRPAAQVVAERMAGIPSATPRWARFRALQDLSLGSPDSAWHVGLRHADGQETLVALARVISRPRLDPEPRPAPVAELRPGVMYVDLTRIADSTFEAAVPRLEAAHGIVFDMRGYPSRLNTPRVLAHLSDSTMHSAKFEVPIVTRPDREGVRYLEGGWPVPPAQPRFHARVAFLTDGRAISYAETTMGIVEAYHLGDIVGDATAGTNGNVNPFTLPGGYAISWTGMRVLKHDGTTHHGVGILPTARVQRSLRGVREGRDEVLEAGVRLVTGASPNR